MAAHKGASEKYDLQRASKSNDGSGMPADHRDHGEMASTHTDQGTLKYSRLLQQLWRFP
jgi:hypothetical protein